MTTITWSGWTPLGNGSFPGDPVVAVDCYNKLHVFALGFDDGVYRIRQDARNNQWTEWVSIGTGHYKGRPAVGRNSDGRLEIFALGKGSDLFHAWQQSLDKANPWGDWTSLGSTQTAMVGDPVVGADHTGRLHVFIRGADNRLYFIRQSEPSGVWTSWVSVNGRADMQGNPTVARNSDGRLELYMRSADNGLYHAWQPSTDSSQPWSEWARLGTTDVFPGDPTAIVGHSGRVTVFTRGFVDGVYKTRQSEPRGDWTTWSAIPFPGGLGSHQAQSTPGAGLNAADDRLEVFVRADDNNVYHAWQDQAPDQWSNTGYALLGSGAFQGNPAVGRNDDGRLEVFIRGTDNRVYHVWQLFNGTTPPANRFQTGAFVALDRSSHCGVTYTSDATGIHFSSASGPLGTYLRRGNGTVDVFFSHVTCTYAVIIDRSATQQTLTVLRMTTGCPQIFSWQNSEFIGTLRESPDGLVFAVMGHNLTGVGAGTFTLHLLQVNPGTSTELGIAAFSAADAANASVSMNSGDIVSVSGNNISGSIHLP